MTVYRKMLPGFHQRLAGEALSNWAGVVGPWIPLQQRKQLRRSGERKRIFTPMTTFWNFLAQVLSPAQPCREAVRQVQAARRRHRRLLPSATKTARLAPA